MKKINYLLKYLTILAGLYLAVNNIKEGDIYALLIDLSLIPILFLPELVVKFFEYKICEFNSLFYTIFIIVADLLGSALKLYGSIWWLDVLTHTVSGILISSLVYEYLDKTKQNKNKFKVIINVITIVLSLAVLWEFFEYTVDKISGADAQKVIATGVDDTMEDMLVAFFGSIFFSIIILNKDIDSLLVKYFKK